MSAEEALQQWKEYMEQLYNWILEQYNLAEKGMITQQQYEQALEEYNKRISEAEKEISKLQAQINAAGQQATPSPRGSQARTAAYGRSEMTAAPRGGMEATQASMTSTASSSLSRGGTQSWGQSYGEQLPTHQFDESTQIGRAAEQIVMAMNSAFQHMDIKQAMQEELMKIRSMMG